MVIEKKYIKFGISDINIASDIVDALLGFQAFSGNHDYISSFFRKGKIICFKTMTQSSIFFKKNKSFFVSFQPWLHCFRANYISEILKRSIARNPEILQGQKYGCAAEGRIHLVKEMFPDDINEILVYDEYVVKEVNGDRRMSKCFADHMQLFYTFI